MRRFWILLFALLVACGTTPNPDGSADSGVGNGAGGDATRPVAASSLERAALVADAPAAVLAAGFNNAGFDILRQETLDGNSVLSPVSIGHAVLMARGAADQATGAAIDSALALPEGLAAHDAWNLIDQMIQDANGTVNDIDGEPSPTVTIADRIWPATGTTPDQEWVDLLASHHGSDVATIDPFQAEASRAEINEWVSDATEGLIPDLVPEGFILPDTTLILTDAIYFKAQWQTIFGKYGSEDRDFFKLDGTTQPTTFMHDLENRGARGIGDGWAAASLPYLGDDFSMLIIVPDQGQFETMRDRLDADLIAEVDSAIAPGPYELLLPKWETTSKIDLLPWLTEIGAAPGEYPGISPGTFLYGGVHAADIAVDEIGTVAAAATALGFVESGPPEPEFTIRADRPFFYLIRHNETGLVLFLGQVADPS